MPKAYISNENILDVFCLSVSPKLLVFPQAITCLCQGTVLLLILEKSIIFNSIIPFFTAFVAKFYGREVWWF